MREAMSSQEIHEFGIEIVFNQMKEEAFEILVVNTDLDVNPQILANKDDQIIHVAIRTACYPNKGELESEEIALSLIRYANENRASCYFASVGIANAEGENDDEMSIPRKGAGFYVAYEGLKILTTNDRIRVLGD